MQIKAIDLFCGIGGLTRGLLDSGIIVTLGIDNEESCRYAYEHNNHATFLNLDIREVNSDILNPFYLDADYTVLVGCAPCQPFSKYSRTASIEKRLEKWFLINEFSRLVKEVSPDLVSMENVPELASQDIFFDFIKELENEGYHVSYDLLYCPNYKIPQSRTRLVLLASRLGPINMPAPVCEPSEYLTVSDAIGHLPKIKAGEYYEKDPVHYSSRLSTLNMSRIKASTPGGTWEEWDESLIADCHKKATGYTYKNVYGRMEWNKVSPTITTQFTGFGNGRFGHPEQDRGLSIREGAILQSFPEDYSFVMSGGQMIITHLTTQIGNAVPVKLGEAIGKAIIKHIEGVNYE